MAKSTNKRGRPKLPDGQRKIGTGISLDPVVMAAARRKAKDSGVSISALVEAGLMKVCK